MVCDPIARREAQERRCIEATLHAKVHVLDGGTVPQPRELQQPREAAILARDVFALQQQRETILEIERDDIGQAPLFVERVRHRGQFQAMQQFGGLLGEHVRGFRVAG